MGERAELLEEAARTIRLLEEAVRMLSDESVKKDEIQAADVGQLSGALQYYYDDFKKLDVSDLTVEDADRLYGVLSYVFEEIKKAGVALT